MTDPIDALSWIAAATTLTLLMLYEVALAWGQRLRPDRLTRSSHAKLREDWFRAAGEEAGSELLAVQTLRNSMSSATMTASTAAIGLMGTITLAAPSLHERVNGSLTWVPAFTPRVALELVLMAVLFISMVSSAMSVRYYNHTSFICAMPVGSPARRRWSEAGVVYVRRAGVLYGWGLRHLIMVAPIVASILQPLAGPVAAVAVIFVMLKIDRMAGGAPSEATVPHPAIPPR